MSSTAIVIPVLVESKRLGALVGRASFSVLLFQDLAVAPFLVMAGAFAGGNERGLGWALLSALVPAALALAALIVFGRIALRPFFHFVAETEEAEFFMAACLLVVLGDGLAAARAASRWRSAPSWLGSCWRRPISPRDRSDDRAVQGPAARALLRLGRGQIDPALILARPTLILGLAAALIAAKALILIGLAAAFRLPARGAEMAMLLAPGGNSAP